ncbi:hypothetical protein ACM2NL_28760, partial [Escherichia coli]
TNRPLTDFGGKTSIFSHPVYLFLREFSLQDFRGGSYQTEEGCSQAGHSDIILYSVMMSIQILFVFFLPERP